MMQHVLFSILLVSAYRSGAADPDLVSPFDDWHPEERLDESFLQNRDEIVADWQLQIIEALQQNERAELFGPESEAAPELTSTAGAVRLQGRLRRAEADDETAGTGAENAESQLQTLVDELTATSESKTIQRDGIALLVADKQGKTMFDIRTSKMTSTKKMNLASGSKMIAGITLLKCINDTPALTLESTTGEILGWTGKNQDIIISKLGGFATGELDQNTWNAFNVCKMNPWKTNQQCVNAHLKNADFANPGTNRYEAMGMSHHIVAAMCENASGRSFMSWFNELKNILGINDNSFTYSCAACYDVNAWFPFGTASTWAKNPSLAAGLSANAVGLTKFLNLVLNKGAYNGRQLIAPNLIERMGQNPYYKNVKGAVDYGFFTGRQGCKGQEQCNTFGHGGLYGMKMWVDMEHGYTGVLMMMANPMESANLRDAKRNKLENEIKAVLDRVLAPTEQPTSMPSFQPTTAPTTVPTFQPTSMPSSQPTSMPSFQPTSMPSSQPILMPSFQPTSMPSSQPTLMPSFQPTSMPSSQPTSMPSQHPTSMPSQQPTVQPTSNPTPAPEPATPERNHKTVKGCSCKETWTYKGKKYHGCNVTPDTKKPWCRVSGPEACTKGWKWIFTSPWDWCESAMVTEAAANQ